VNAILWNGSSKKRINAKQSESEHDKCSYSLINSKCRRTFLWS